MSISQVVMAKRRGFLKSALCFLLASLLPLPTLAAEQKPVRIAVEGGFPPFNYLDANSKLQGFDIEIANALCEAGDFKCDFIIHKWDSIIPDLLSGDYDAIVSSMSMSEERRKEVSFTKKYYTSPSVFIAKKGSDISDIGPSATKNLKIGVTYATAQGAYIDKLYHPVSDVTVFPNSPDLYKGLADGEVDLILEDKLAVYDWLANTKAGQCCAFVGPDITDVTYFGEGAGIALRPADSDLRDRFNAALSTIQSDGTYDMINAKYFPFSIQ